MNYCDHCHILCEDVFCPRCGDKFVRPPEPEDYVYLTQKDYPWCNMLEGALKDAGIPAAANEAVAGAWRTTRLGPRFECHQIFVPYGSLEQATQIMSDMFDESNSPEDFEWEETEE